MFWAIFNKIKISQPLLFLTLAFPIIFVIVFFTVLLYYPLPLQKPYSCVIKGQNDEILNISLSSDDKWRIYYPLADIDPTLVKIILEKEDKYFDYHFGLNPVAMLRAGINNIYRNKVTSGASTITMQLARLLMPKQRTIKNKLIEMIHSIWLECTLKKHEILELYLNLIPYGGNIEGVGAASLLYYGKSPNHISIAQAMVLSIVPNKPNSWSLKKAHQRLLSARNRWLEYMLTQQVISASQYKDAHNEPLELSPQARPREIPHLALRLKHYADNTGTVNSSINYTFQKTVEQIAHEKSEQLKKMSIHNLAVLVVNNYSHEVISYVGSQEFGDAKFGQIDGVKTQRSPGSTLKPFVYGMAFDKGIYTPQTQITDVPTNFDGYAPENYDKKFLGQVSIDKALGYSLNIPAVKTLLKIGKNNFQSTLFQAGLSRFDNQNTLGLSLVLGGCTASLEEITALYVALANNGKYSKLKFTKNKVQNKSFQLLSSESSYMIYHILSQLTRPDLPHKAFSNTHIPEVAWKTGTSYGRKDAWCIGYNSKYTVGVWLGNFDGKGVPELTGADIALPFMFSIFNQIDYNSTTFLPKSPPKIAKRLVCRSSGKVPSENCDEQVWDYYIKGISDASVCNHLQWKYISAEEHMGYCSHCLPINGYKKKLFHNYPPDLLEYFKVQHISYQAVPKHNPYCTGIQENNELKIVSPTANKTYLIETNDDAEILLRCHAKYDVNTVYWYINDQFYKSESPRKGVFFQPKVGKIKISCADDKGNNNDIEITVSRY